MSELSVRGAVRLTGYTRQQIYNLIVNCKIRAKKRERQYQINRRSLLAYCERRKAK
jgi:hypothetical protein